MKKTDALSDLNLEKFWST